MKKFYVLLISILLGGISKAQEGLSYPYQEAFDAAYDANPNVPKGVLEAVAWSQTRIKHLTGNHQGCTGMPAVRGVMGLTEDGQGYFNDNLKLASDISGFSIHEIKTDPAKNIMAYANAYNHVYATTGGEASWQKHETVLRALCEIPTDTNIANQYALASYTYQILNFLNDGGKQVQYNMPARSIPLVDIYGEENLHILSSSRVMLSPTAVIDEHGDEFTPAYKTMEYGPALWVATPPCNYSSRSGTPISAVTVHTIQGSYAGAISWAQNCISNVSYHYVARSSDGQITQMLYEADKGWHVGSENPYTIGIEHEGYVTDPAWYTEAMYTSSADLVRDITESGYGINPLRTYHGVATAGTYTLGACIRIKGHQHYPGATHTDPGINWDWEHYYQLINDDPTITYEAASSGTFYDTGGAGGDYLNDERTLTLIQPAGAVNITLTFNSFNLEEDWDYMRVYDGTSLDDPLLGIYTGTDHPGTLTSTGGAILIEFRSDCSTTESGWDITWSSIPGPVPGDVIAPSTAVTLSGDWYTEDFTSLFTDEDDTAGTGVKHRFYQVIDWDGTEWRANSSHGFFSDNFDLSLHPEWTVQTGTWGTASEKLNQSDEGLDNTNVWANLNQDDDDIWLFHWGQMIDGAGANKRGGFHFMCDDPTLLNRGNSYFIWFRSDDNKLQIYKTVSDVFSLEADIPFTINDGQWYDIKTVYDKSTGLIEVWVDDVYAASWLDPSPYTSGSAISARSGNSDYHMENLKVYHGRSASELITIGGPSAEVRYQNPDPLTPSCKVKSIVIDSSANVSVIGHEFANIDWTPPLDITTINDGEGADIATTGTNTELSANWTPTTDQHSDIAGYWYSIGTSPLATDIVDWTDNWYDTTVTHTGLELIDGTTYYVCVYAENGAGLFSDTACTDGQTLVIPSDPPVAGFVVYGTNVCQPDSIQFENSSSDATSYTWSVPGATPSSSTDVNPYFFFPASGTYEVTLTATGPGGSDVYVQSILVESFEDPDAVIAVSDPVKPITAPFMTFSNLSENANGYYWDFDDGGNSTDFEPWHEYTEVGIYTVMLIAINGTCPNDTAWHDVQITEPVTLDESEIAVVKVRPNPATDFIIVSGIEKWSRTQSTIEILDNRGRIVYSNTLSQEISSLTIDLDSDLSDGLYVLRIRNEEESEKVKFVVDSGK